MLLSEFLASFALLACGAYLEVMVDSLIEEGD